MRPELPPSRTVIVMSRLDKATACENRNAVSRVLLELFYLSICYPPSLQHNFTSHRSNLSSSNIKMPRDGSGASDNAIEQGETLVHGAGSAPNDVSKSIASRTFKLTEA
jgi:hypothetical protein